MQVEEVVQVVRLQMDVDEAPRGVAFGAQSSGEASMDMSGSEDDDDDENALPAVLQHILQTGGGRGIPNLVKHASTCAAVCRGWRQIVLFDGSDLRLAFGADLFGGSGGASGGGRGASGVGRDASACGRGASGDGPPASACGRGCAVAGVYHGVRVPS